MRPYMYKAYQSSFNIEKYFIFLKTTQKQNMELCVFNGVLNSKRVVHLD